MHQHATAMEFEKAQIIKDKLTVLERYRSKSTVVNPNISNVDVFSLVRTGNLVYVNFIKVVDGAIVQSHTIEVQTKLDENDEEILGMAITEFRQRYDSDAVEVILPLKPGFDIPGITFTVPKRGDKKQLLDLSERNASYFRLERQKQRDLVDPERRTKRILGTIQKDLNLKDLPERIECFDNSNIQGTNPVAAVVVFTNAKPDKKEYRHFNIRTVEGPDDFASMYEIVTRRYKRMIEEEKPLPQLIIIDGGKGQLNAAYKSLTELGIHDKTEIIGIAKRLEEIYKPGDPLPLYLDKKSETLRIVQQLRDEAHRFAITHHRKNAKRAP
jgi:excinuclease ABC subunit C